MLVDLFPVDWAAGDRPAPDGDGEAETFMIRAVGKDAGGRAVVAHIDFFPYFYAELAQGLSESARKLAVMDLVKRHGALPGMSCAVSRKSMWGFTNGARLWVAQLCFGSLAAATRARYALKRAKCRTFEAGVDPLVRFFHVRGVRPAAWVRLDCQQVCGLVEEDSTTPGQPLRVRCDFRRAGPSPLTARPPLVLASWDIEVFSKSGEFPLAANPADRVIQIAVTFERYDTGASKSVVLCLGDTADVPGVEVVCLADEADLISEFPRVLAERGADVLLSYNGDQFDWKYLHARCAGVLLDDQTADPLVDLSAFGRVPDEPGGELLTKSLVSAAYGDNTFTRLATPGQLNLDLMQYVKREHKLPSVALNAVAKEFLGDAKLDLPPAEIFRKFLGSREDRAEIAAYAAKDTQLPLRLLRKLAVFENLAEMANAVSVPIEYLLTRGQQIKVWSLILQTARAKGFVCPDDAGIGLADGEKYVGATVLEARRGAYFDIVSGLDFASLYPSIIRAYNLCPSTLVLDDRYAAVPGVEYRDVAVGGGVVHRFAVGADVDGAAIGAVVDAVVPSLLRDLAQFRTAAKREMAAAKARGDAFAASVANGKQLAYKVSANSVYGFLGASKGFLPCLPVAAATTATGREMIEKTSRMVCELVPGSRVVYGDTDSVMVILDLGPDKRHDMAAHFAAAAAAAAAITATFPKPIELEFEKCYAPYLLFSKKRYSGELIKFSWG
jgi:DNA polymerase delta subunit 1